MSNPGVIILDKIFWPNGSPKKFQVEDNIGEAIHIHLDDLRFELSISSFLSLAELVGESLLAMGCLPEVFFQDPHFGKQCLPYLKDFIGINIEEIALGDLKCVVYEDGIEKVVPLDGTPAFLCLKGDKDRFINYQQYNLFGQDNISRLEGLARSLRENGYPFKGQYITLFSGQNIIRDGQHRASILLHLYGPQKKVQIQRICFRGKKHHIYSGNVFVLKLRRLISKNIKMLYGKTVFLLKGKRA